MSEPVPTSQRPMNGAISGLAAQVIGNAGTAYAVAHGLDPATASAAGIAAGSAVSGIMATLGDWARGVLEAPEPVGAILRLPFMLLARIG